MAAGISYTIAGVRLAVESNAQLPLVIVFQHTSGSRVICGYGISVQHSILQCAVVALLYLEQLEIIAVDLCAALAVCYIYIYGFCLAGVDIYDAGNTVRHCGDRTCFRSDCDVGVDQRVADSESVELVYNSKLIVRVRLDIQCHCARAYFVYYLSCHIQIESIEYAGIHISGCKFNPKKIVLQCFIIKIKFVECNHQ